MSNLMIQLMLYVVPFRLPTLYNIQCLRVFIAVKTNYDQEPLEETAFNLG